MVRKFTVSMGRFKAGWIRDYPSKTWEGISKSAGRPLDSFSVAIETFSNNEEEEDPKSKKGKRR